MTTHHGYIFYHIESAQFLSIYIIFSYVFSISIVFAKFMGLESCTDVFLVLYIKWTLVKTSFYN